MTGGNNTLKLIILFGSRATGKHGARSDIDVAVLADHPLSLHEKADIGERLARDFGMSEDKIDVVDLWNAPPLLQHEIATKGKLLMGDPFDFVRFKVLVWKRYLDTAKFRRSRETAMKHYVQGTHPQKT